MSPEVFLRKHHRQSIPTWLAEFGPENKPDPDILLKGFFASRVVFYPGSGHDGHAVKTFGSSHAAHCFIYADYGVSQTNIRASLDSPHASFRGYRTLARIDLKRRDFSATGWTPHLSTEELRQLSDRDVYRRAEVYGFVEILERTADLDDAHGPARLAILFLGADGHASYDALFCQDGQRAPFAVLPQEHGFGGDYSSWGGSGITARIAEQTQRLPELLLVDDRTTLPWNGYTKIEGVEPTVGGMWGNRRYLYQRPR